MICFCVLAGTDACRNCEVYKRYIKTDTASSYTYDVYTELKETWEIPDFMTKEKQDE